MPLWPPPKHERGRYRTWCILGYRKGKVKRIKKGTREAMNEAMDSLLDDDRYEDLALVPVVSER